MNVRMKTLLVLTGAGLISLAGGTAMGQELERDKYEQPAYEVLHEADGYEIRRYDAYLVAQIALPGDPRRAMNRGFGPLANYIFGGNAESKSIPMTAPVTHTPVTVEGEDEDERQVVAFIMPSTFTMETLPAPTGDRVELETIEEKVVAAMRFPGRYSHRLMAEKEEELRAQLKQDGIEISGAPIYAAYDPPSTPAQSRRNEVMLPVEYPAQKE